MEFDSALLASIASGGLGHWVELDNGSRKYCKDDDCVACLKDLQGFFRFDDQVERSAFFAVSKYNFAKTDLVPLLVTYPEDYDVVYNTLKVCTHLTMPSAEIAPSLVAQQCRMMQLVCDAFLSDQAIEVIVTLLAEPLSRHPKMNDRDVSLVELVIIFLRNLLAATAPPPGALFRERENARRFHSGLLSKFQEAEVLDLLCIIAQRARERPFKSQSSVLLEIYLDIFMFVSPEQLRHIPSIESTVQPSLTDAERERNKKKAYQSGPRLPLTGPGRTVTRFGPSRQQFAGAVFMRRHKDHGSSVLVRHSPTVKELPPMPEAPNKKQAKSHLKDKLASSNDQFVSEKTVEGNDVQLTAKEIELRIWLKDILDKFLHDAYTPLVGQVFKEARPGLDVSRMEEDEFERFVRFVAFCTKYIRLGEERKLKEKLEKQANNNLRDDESLRDDASTDKDGEHSPFACINATMGWDAFHTIQVLFLLSVEREVQYAKDKEKPYRRYILLYSLGPLLREMLMTLDLARIAGNEADRQAADRLQRKLFHNDDRTGMLQVITQLIRDYKYHIHPRYHAVHLAEILHVVLATLDRLANHGSFQVSKTMKKHKRRKNKKKASEEAPSSQPEHDASSPQEEVPHKEGEEQEGGKEKAQEQEHQEKDTGEAGEEDDEDDDIEDAGRVIVKEQVFDAPRRLRSTCAHPMIINFYTWLLQGYRKNSDLTNTAIVSFLERIAAPAPRGMGLHCMLWQLSVIRTFHAVMADPHVQKNQKYRRLFKLCASVMRTLFKTLCPDLSEFQTKIDQSNSRITELEQELEDLKIIGAGEEGLDEKLEKIRGDIHREKSVVHEATVEMKMKEECASLAFVEILFWKNSTVAESISQEYNWKRHLEIRHSDLGQGQLGFASFKPRQAPGHFTDEQTQMLIDAFENCNGRKDCLSHLVFEFGGAFKKAHVSKKLKELGLEKGKLTERQQKMLHILAERYAHQGPKYRFQTIQEHLGGGFTVRQVKNHMRKLGLIESTAKKTHNNNNSDDEDGDDDEESSASESEEAMVDAEKAFDTMLAEISPTKPSRPSDADDDSGKEDDDSNRQEKELESSAPSSPAHDPSQSPAQEPSNKRKSPHTDDIDEEKERAEARKKALELLRSKHRHSSPDPPSKPAQEEESDEEEEDKQGENANANTESPVKAFGRRLLKRSRTDDALPNSNPLGDLLGDLEDY
ncbi:hypothetical protein M9435_005846 [Picochlorum sp. BPE23]|nr:hypothetical protein M9435_005846 [Picochlorum sp. BPE23]